MRSRVEGEGSRRGTLIKDPWMRTARWRGLNVGEAGWSGLDRGEQWAESGANCN